MTDFLVLHQYGPGAADLEVCGLFEGRKAEEGEQVLREGACKGAGRYIAVKLTGSTELVATPSLEFQTPEAAADAAKAEPS